MNQDKFKELVSPIIDKFISKLNGRFKEHVSDKFIKAYLLDKFWETNKIFKENAQNGAYIAAQNLFENLIEFGCVGYGKMNGHHVAQEFSSLFKPEILQVYPLNDDSNKDMILEYKDLTGRWYEYTKDLQDNIYFKPTLGTRVRKITDNNV